MGFKKEKPRMKTIRGKEADVVFEFAKVDKADGLVFTVTDVYFDTSEENGDFAMLINDAEQTRLFAPAIEVAGLKECYEDGSMPTQFDVEIQEHTSKNNGRKYFTMNY